MPRITPQPYRILIKIFQKAGFIIAREGKKHVLMHRPGTARPISIPKYDEVGIDIIKANMRTAGMSREEYFKFLSDP
jgi:hypothetical protein